MLQGLEEERELNDYNDENSSSDDLLDGEDSNNKDSDVPMDIEEEDDEVNFWEVLLPFCNVLISSTWLSWSLTYDTLFNFSWYLSVKDVVKFQAND